MSEAVQSHLAELPPSNSRDPPLQLRLPQDNFLESLGCGQLLPLQTQCTYGINTASSALRHATGLLSLLSVHLAGHQLSSNAPPMLQETIPWLIDAAVRINVIQNRWRELSGPCLPQLLRSSINILDIMKRSVNTDTLVEEKTNILLVHLCLDALTQRQATVGLENATGVDDRLLSIVVVKISEACLSFAAVSRLASLQITAMLESQISYETIAPEGTDLWVSQPRTRGQPSC